LARVHDYRAAQEQEATPPPTDELDSARALSDVEMHARLIERSEERLRAIDSALNLLERGRYGICDLCGEQIPVEHLRALPFATRCVDCQAKQNRERRVGEGTVDEPFRRTWDLPEEMAESTETSRDEYVAPSEESGEKEPSFTTESTRPRRRGRPRKGLAMHTQPRRK
jgi:RNA polymerase-binding protein DksA